MNHDCYLVIIHVTKFESQEVLQLRHGASAQTVQGLHACYNILHQKNAQTRTNSRANAHTYVIA